MPDTPVLAAIRERRSIRKYTDRPLDRDTLLAVLEAGRWAPSGLNNQPWRFLALTAGDPRQEILAGLTKYAHIVRGAKALIAVFLDTEKVYSAMKDHQSAGAAVQNMLLAAHSLGLGAVWLGQIVNQGAEAVQALELDPKYELQALIALGWPDQKGSSNRLALNDLLLEEF